MFAGKINFYHSNCSNIVIIRFNNYIANNIFLIKFPQISLAQVDVESLAIESVGHIHVEIDRINIDVGELTEHAAANHVDITSIISSVPDDITTLNNEAVACVTDALRGTIDADTIDETLDECIDLLNAKVTEYIQLLESKYQILLLIEN